MMVLATMMGVSGANERLPEQQSEARPVENLLQCHIARPERDKAQRDIGDDGGQRGPQNVAPLDGSVGQPFRFGHVDVVFTGVDEEERPLTENRCEDGTHKHRGDRQDQVFQNAEEYSSLPARRRRLHHAPERQPAQRCGEDKNEEDPVKPRRCRRGGGQGYDEAVQEAAVAATTKPAP